MQLPLIKKVSAHKNCQIGICLYVCYYFRLQEKGVWVKHHQIIEFSDIHYRSFFSFVFRGGFPYHKNWKAERCMKFDKTKSPLCLQFIKDIVNQLSHFITQRIKLSLDISNSQPPVVFQEISHLSVRRNIDKILRFRNGRESLDQGLKDLNDFGRLIYPDLIWQAGFKRSMDSGRCHLLIK